MIELVPVRYYGTIFYWVMFAFCLLTGLYFSDSKDCRKLLRQYSFVLPLFFSIILILYIGLRPSSWIFGDMGMYRHRWTIIDDISSDGLFNYQTEWFFDFVMVTCKKIVPNVQFWFLIIELFYIGSQLWACKKLLWENTWLAIMFVFFSYQFYTYGTNGIRNGMGVALFTLSLAYYCDRNRIGYVIGTLIFVLALGTHRTVLLPMAALLASIFVIKNIKFATYIWLACIVLSLFAGGFFQGIFTNLGFDDRMSDYSSYGDQTMNQFSHTGFRWDFLIYSSMPVLLAWYVNYRGIYDRIFTILANTYILANSFWILVIRVAFSNRFAYLSWFMYALVIAYAVIRVPIWKDQDRKAGQILLAHTAFTIIMFLIGK